MKKALTQRNVEAGSFNDSVIDEGMEDTLSEINYVVDGFSNHLIDQQEMNKDVLLNPISDERRVEVEVEVQSFNDHAIDANVEGNFSEISYITVVDGMLGRLRDQPEMDQGALLTSISDKEHTEAQTINESLIETDVKDEQSATNREFVSDDPSGHVTEQRGDQIDVLRSSLASDEKAEIQIDNDGPIDAEIEDSRSDTNNKFDNVNGDLTNDMPENFSIPPHSPGTSDNVILPVNSPVKGQFNDYESERINMEMEEPSATEEIAQNDYSMSLQTLLRRPNFSTAATNDRANLPPAYYPDMLEVSQGLLKDILSAMKRVKFLGEKIEQRLGLLEQAGIHLQPSQEPEVIPPDKLMSALIKVGVAFEELKIRVDEMVPSLPSYEDEMNISKDNLTRSEATNNQNNEAAYRGDMKDGSYYQREGTEFVLPPPHPSTKIRSTSPPAKSQEPDHERSYLKYFRAKCMDIYGHMRGNLPQNKNEFETAFHSVTNMKNKRTYGELLKAFKDEIKLLIEARAKREETTQYSSNTNKDSVPKKTRH